jgi:flagellar biosynthesis/type III secretory pathway protein FliH
MPLVWRGCEATAHGQIYMHLLEQAKRTQSNTLLSRYSASFPKILQLLPGRDHSHQPKGGKTEDALQIVQAEGKSKVRRERLFAAGKTKGLAEGTELGRALGFAEGIERGKELLKVENASLRTSNEDLHGRLCDTLEQFNGIATENLLAT